MREGSVLGLLPGLLDGHLLVHVVSLYAWYACPVFRGPIYEDLENIGQCNLITSLKTPSLTSSYSEVKTGLRRMDFGLGDTVQPITLYLEVRRLKPKPSSLRFEFGSCWLWNGTFSSCPVSYSWIENAMSKGKQMSPVIWIWLVWDSVCWLLTVKFN